LGPLREWEDRLRVSKEAGYNAIHFTPVHTLGISNSAYSIADYHQLNPAFESDLNGLESLVKKMEREWHMLSIQDVVWNHCAKNSEWIWQHPVFSPDALCPLINLTPYCRSAPTTASTLRIFGQRSSWIGPCAS